MRWITWWISLEGNPHGCSRLDRDVRHRKQSPQHKRKKYVLVVEATEEEGSSRWRSTILFVVAPEGVHRCKMPLAVG